MKVRRLWPRGKRKAVLLVAPTGSGKTEMGVALVDAKWRVLWVVHTRELVKQAARRLRAVFGDASVSEYMPGGDKRPGARIQVWSTQSLVLHEPPAGHFDLIVLDEAHHYEADVWRGIVKVCTHDKLLGLTATPERKDGRALDDTFDFLVVAASQKELLDGKWLVPSRIVRPSKRVPKRHLAQDPVLAVLRYAKGKRTFVYAPSVAEAEGIAASLRAHGVMAQVIEAKTGKQSRDAIIADFRAGKISVIVNVRTMCEGVDVPEVECIVLAQPFVFVGTFLQAVGRGRRPAKGKKQCLVVDLVDATYRHGSPDIEREYSLTGKPISGGIPEAGEPNEEHYDPEPYAILDLDLVDTDTGEMFPAVPVPPPSESKAARVAREHMERRLKKRRSPQVRDLIRLFHDKKLTKRPGAK